MMDRRRFFRNSIRAGVALGGLGSVCYGFAESGAVGIERLSVHVPNLPSAFDGTTVAFLTDIHHGPYLALDAVAGMVRTARTLQPDLILLGGDYCLRDRKFIPPCFDMLAGLAAPLGVFGVLGNHDYWHGLDDTRRGMAKAKIENLTNGGTWLTRRGARLRIAGVDDLWCGTPQIAPALADAKADDACVLLCHNPDYVETMLDRRAGLVLSGHTHGGQALLPGVPNPMVPSKYGMKYAHGLVEAPATKVYVSRGLGVTGLPMRFHCPPELTLLTLTC